MAFPALTRTGKAELVRQPSQKPGKLQERSFLRLQPASPDELVPPTPSQFLSQGIETSISPPVFPKYRFSYDYIIAQPSRRSIV